MTVDPTALQLDNLTEEERSAFLAAVEERRRPFVSVDPAMRSGQPTINGTRLRVVAVVDMAWVEGVDVAAEEYDLTRADVLVACWYAGTVGLPGRRPQLAPTPLWRKRWGAWADEVAQALWSVSTVDYEAVPDPPTREVPLPEIERTES